MHDLYMRFECTDSQVTKIIPTLHAQHVQYMGLPCIVHLQDQASLRYIYVVATLKTHECTSLVFVTMPFAHKHKYNSVHKGRKRMSQLIEMNTSYDWLL